MHVPGKIRAVGNLRSTIINQLNLLNYGRERKSVATAMYNYFLETLKGKETFEGKHHF